MEKIRFHEKTQDLKIRLKIKQWTVYMVADIAKHIGAKKKEIAQVLEIEPRSLSNWLYIGNYKDKDKFHEDRYENIVRTVTEKTIKAYKVPTKAKFINLMILWYQTDKVYENELESLKTNYILKKMLNAEYALVEGNLSKGIWLTGTNFDEQGLDVFLKSKGKQLKWSQLIDVLETGEVTKYL